ncbi:response regulator [bacterium]|nr:response regulator [bacterium]
MGKRHILIVEDEAKIVKTLVEYLEKAGYSVSSLESGNQVISFVKKSPPDLILLDIMLPGMDGMEVCREIRKFSAIPILMITARTDEIDRIMGLELGADDYICKPFSPREVMARVKAVFRRLYPKQAGKRIVVGDLELNEDTRQVTVKGQELILTPIEFGLLRVLFSHPNRVFSRNQLTNLVQGYSFEGYDRTIDTHIKNIRKKIGVFLPDKEIISSIYGIGYKINDGY